MTKINKIIEMISPTLKERVIEHLDTHPDEVYSQAEAAELNKLLNHHNQKAVISTLWNLSKQGLIDREKVGNRYYFGSKGAISQVRELKSKYQAK